MKRAAAFLILLASCGRQDLPPAAKARVKLLDLGGEYSRDDYAFLKEVVGGRSTVQLGESITVTEEFPRARLKLMRYLHEEMGFDVVAFEGSAMDAWLAQEAAYSSKSGAAEEEVSMLALHGLWQTQPMREVVGYILSTQGTATPLYLTSFDLQPGSAEVHRNAETVFGAFLAAVRLYDDSKSSGDLEAWKKAFAPVLGCTAPDPGNLPLTELEAWIRQAAGTVDTKRNLVHGNALRAIPDMVRARIQHCRELALAGKSGSTDQAVRDRLSAASVFAVRDKVSQTHRILIWAHHRRVNHNSSGKGLPSMGQHLMASAPDQIYTIGLFAKDGLVFDAPRMALEGWTNHIPRRVAALETEKALAAVSDRDYFLDLAAMPGMPAEWQAVSTQRFEADTRAPGVLGKDYHAVLFVQEVHPADILTMPVFVRKILRMGGFVYDHWVAAAALAMVVLFGVVRVAIWRIRARGRKKPSGGAASA